jgi:DNA ligase-1
MKAFSKLYALLDETTKITAKVRALQDYFEQAPAEDAAWAVYFLIGRKPRQVVPSGKLRAWVAHEAGIPDWLFQESYDAVGDMAETIALLLPAPQQLSDYPLSHWIERRLLPMRTQTEDDQHMTMLQAWRELDRTQRFVWNKLISGGFRVGVSQQLVTRALGDVAHIDPAVVAHRLMGDWEPSHSFFTQLLAHNPADANASRPYPFFLAYALEQPVEELGDQSQWQAEWKWDGIRCQLIRRSGQTFLWSRGEELVTERYPEIAAVGDTLPDGTAIDGEILPWKDECPLPFIQLQRRIGRKAVTRAILAQGVLVPIAKAYSGLTDAEIAEVDRFVRRNMVEKFGAVRTVRPELVFELAFEGLNRSNRHKSGIAVRFPRISRWRIDKPANEADTLDAVRALLKPGSVE